MKTINAIVAMMIAVLGLVALGTFFHWTVDRVYVPEGKSLLLRYKGPLMFGKRSTPAAGELAEKGEVGVQRELRGPGRHFYCPIWWERKLIDDVVVEPGEVAVVVSKIGQPLPSGEFLVDGELDGPNRSKHNGTLRRVYGPGRYRVNNYAYEFKIVKTDKRVEANGATKTSGWVDIPTGYVGVVTYLADSKSQNKKAGTQDDVLQPGLYPINPHEQQVDIVFVGYLETSISVDAKKGPDGKELHDESGEPIAAPHKGINFASSDGFDIQLDFTAIWGVMPEEAAEVVRRFGSVKAAELKVIIPQSESICRNNGAKMGAVELLVGETRQQFQTSTSHDFQEVLKDKDLTLLYGLVRHIYIPQEVRIPIQMGYIADELKLTREQETLTAKTEANLREAEQKVILEGSRIKVETDKLVANAMAEGAKKAKEVEAETKQLVAEIDKKISLLEAKKTEMAGKAKFGAEQMSNEARAQKFQLAVDAFGDPIAYNKWQFAEGLPEMIDLKLFYAGPGTLWTDLKNIMPTLPLSTEQTPATKGSASPAKAPKK